MAHAVNAAVAPFVSKEGASVFKKFIAAMRAIVAPARREDPLRALKKRIVAQQGK